MLSKLAVLGLGVALLTACFRHTGYRGDGRFVDNGWLNYSGRYAIDLGPIDLARAGQWSYTLKGLPRAELCVGIVVHADDSVRLGGVGPTHQVVVRMVLRSSNGQVAVSEQGPLSSWVATTGYADGHSFFYRKGEARDVPLRDGSTRGERLNEKASGGWGTYFKAERGVSYLLTFEVVDSDALATIPARLEVHGWNR